MCPLSTAPVRLWLPQGALQRCWWLRGAARAPLRERRACRGCFPSADGYCARRSRRLPLRALWPALAGAPPGAARAPTVPVARGRPPECSCGAPALRADRGRRVQRAAHLFFFFNDTATTEIYTLSLHDALPIYAIAIITAFHLRIVLGEEPWLA